MTNQVLVKHAFDPQDDVELDAGVGERSVADKWFKILDGAFRHLQHISGHFDRGFFHMGKIAVVTDADGYNERTFGIRQGIVGNDRSGDFLVGHDDHVVGGLLNRGAAPVHIGDDPFFTAG